MDGISSPARFNVFIFLDKVFNCLVDPNETWVAALYTKVGAPNNRPLYKAAIIIN